MIQDAQHAEMLSIIQAITESVYRAVTRTIDTVVRLGASNQEVSHVSAAKNGWHVYVRISIYREKD